MASSDVCGGGIVRVTSSGTPGGALAPLEGQAHRASQHSLVVYGLLRSYTWRFPPLEFSTCLAHRPALPSRASRNRLYHTTTATHTWIGTGTNGTTQKGMTKGSPRGLGTPSTRLGSSASPDQDPPEARYSAGWTAGTAPTAPPRSDATRERT